MVANQLGHAEIICSEVKYQNAINQRNCKAILGKMFYGDGVPNRGAGNKIRFQLTYNYPWFTIQAFNQWLDSNFTPNEIIGRW